MENIYEKFMSRLKSLPYREIATVVYLQGDLGSGKTTFTKNLCKYLDLNIDITSPTFTILKSYEFNVESFKRLIHIDAYRLDSYKDLQKIKIEDYLKDKENLIFIEWPSVIEGGDIEPDIVIKFDYVDDMNNRFVEMEGV